MFRSRMRLSTKGGEESRLEVSASSALSQGESQPRRIQAKSTRVLGFVPFAEMLRQTRLGRLAQAVQQRDEVEPTHSHRVAARVLHLRFEPPREVAQRRGRAMPAGTGARRARILAFVVTEVFDRFDRDEQC